MAGNRRARFSSGQSERTKPAAQAASPPGTASSLLNAEKLKALYAAMVKCRILRGKFGDSARRREHSAQSLRAPGAEAVIAGTVCDLLAGDCVAPSPLTSLVRLLRGTPIAEILSSEAKARHETPACIMQLGIGLGLALAFKRQKQSNVVLCLLDEDLLENAAWKKAIAFAAERKLPLVCMVETRSLAEELRTSAQGCGAPAITVDGGDVVAIYRVMQEATRRARQGHGPTLIEAKLQGTDPIEFMEHYLRHRGLWSDAWKAKLVEDCKRDLQRAGRTGR